MYTHVPAYTGIFPQPNKTRFHVCELVSRHCQSKHIQVSTSYRLLTYILAYVKLYDLVGHAPDVRCRNESGHFQLQWEEIRELSSAMHESPFLTVLAAKSP